MKVIDKFKDFYAFKSVIGLEVNIDLSEEIFITHLSREGTNIAIKETKQLAGLDQAQDFLKGHKDAIISLLVRGRGVLLRSFPVSENDKSELSEQEIQTSLPTYSENDFYISQLRGVGDIWISIIKKKILDQLLEKLQECNISPIQVYIGPFALANILTQLNVYNSTYVFQGHRIEVNNEKQWINYSHSNDNVNPFNMKVGNSLIKHEFISSYAVAFSTLMDDYLPDFSIVQDDLAYSFSEEKEKIKFKVNAILVLCTFFVLLLLNTIFFNKYYQENQKLEGSISTQNVSDQQLVDMRSKTMSYEKSLKDLGWNGGVSKAMLMEKVGMSLDKYPSISLTNITINPNPERKRSNQETEVEDNRNKILLSGRVSTLEGLNEWVRDLNQSNWVKSVRISKFGRSEAYNDDFNVFRIELIFHYEY